MSHPPSRLLALQALVLGAVGLPVSGCGGCRPKACEGGTSTPVLLADGRPSGYERCADGTIHRPEALEVDPTIPLAACSGDEQYHGDCTTDADCKDRPNGRCITEEYMDTGYWDTGDDLVTYCGCVYSCGGDADCEADEACVVPEALEGLELTVSYPACVPADCSTDEACLSRECGLYVTFDGCGYDVGLACRTEEDLCRLDESCGEDAECSIDRGESTWTCVEEYCAIGRPLTVDGAPRTAPTEASDRWAERLAPARLSRIGADRRAALAARWSGVAALEHASIGSFARFTLQLLALGAPADLLAETQRAAGDEVRHAGRAWGLASAYGGREIGPGPLDLAGAMPALDPAGVLTALIEEACVGEVVGAAEAAEAARRCQDPVVREVLEGVADDEARHAALAWRALRWLLQERAPALAGLAEEALAVAIRRVLAVPPGFPDLGEDGQLGSVETLRVRLVGVRQIVVPAAFALGLRFAERLEGVTAEEHQGAY